MSDLDWLKPACNQVARMSDDTKLRPMPGNCRCAEHREDIVIYPLPCSNKDLDFKKMEDRVMAEIAKMFSGIANPDAPSWPTNEEIGEALDQINPKTEAHQRWLNALAAHDLALGKERGEG